MIFIVVVVVVVVVDCCCLVQNWPPNGVRCEAFEVRPQPKFAL